MTSQIYSTNLFLSFVSGEETLTYNDVSSSCVPCGLLKMIISISHDFQSLKNILLSTFYPGTNYEPSTQNRWRSLHGLVVCLMLFTIFVRLGSTSTCAHQQLLLGLHTNKPKFLWVFQSVTADILWENYSKCQNFPCAGHNSGNSYSMSRK